MSGINRYSQDRESLEAAAISACPPELYYSLLDELDATSDEELLRIIERYRVKSEAEILLDPGASYWLKDQVVALRKRDPVDALRDIEVLARLARERLTKNEIKKEY